MDVTKVLPWGLCTILAGVCWQQQSKHEEYQRESEEKIAYLEQEKRSIMTQSSMESSTVRSTNRREFTEATPILEKDLRSLKKSGEFIQPNQEQSLSEYDLDAMVEDRAWKRIEEIEEERREERFERITEHTQIRIQEWAEEYDWSQDTQDSMMDIMTTFIRGRVDFHAQLKNGSIEREEIRPYFQKLAQERNDALVDLIGEDQFLELEDELKHRNGPPPPR